MLCLDIDQFSNQTCCCLAPCLLQPLTFQTLITPSTFAGIEKTGVLLWQYRKANTPSSRSRRAVQYSAVWKGLNCTCWGLPRLDLPGPKRTQAPACKGGNHTYRRRRFAARRRSSDCNQTELPEPTCKPKAAIARTIARCIPARRRHVH